MLLRVITLVCLCLSLLAGGLTPVAAAAPEHGVAMVEVTAAWTEHDHAAEAEAHNAADHVHDAPQIIATAIANMGWPPGIERWSVSMGEVSVLARRFLPDEPPRQVG